MHDATRPRVRPSVRHRVEDGVKKHRGLTAASSLRVSRHVTLRKAPSSSSATQQSKSRTARTSRAAGAYLRTQCIRWVPVRVLSGVWPRLCAPERKCQATVQGEARTLLGAGACAHDSAGVFVRIRTRNACAFATARHTVAARKKKVAYRLVRKRTESMLRAACLRWNCTCHGILHSHIPSASTGNQCRYVCVCVHACVVYLRAR